MTNKINALYVSIESSLETDNYMYMWRTSTRRSRKMSPVSIWRSFALSLNKLLRNFEVTFRTWVLKTNLWGQSIHLPLNCLWQLLGLTWGVDSSSFSTRTFEKQAEKKATGLRSVSPLGVLSEHYPSPVWLRPPPVSWGCMCPRTVASSVLSWPGWKPPR